MMAIAHEDSAWSRFAAAFPVLLLAQLLLLTGSVANALAGADVAAGSRGAVAGMALLQSLLVLLRSLPLLLLLSLPLLALKRPRLRAVALALLWSIFIAGQALLDQYYQVAHVPLGADLFGYSLAEIRTTVADAAPLNLSSVLALALPLLVIWCGLLWLARRSWLGSNVWTGVLLVTGLVAWLLPLPTAGLGSDSARELAANKLAWFSADVWRWSGGGAGAASAGTARAATPVAGADPHEAALDPKYPFLRQEQTADTLGPYFAATSDGRAPNVVFIVVEGLGRSFSGPQATLGSFTPFLDELATRSLYFDNFLANQGRTFGVLPTLFGSAPFAAEGFTALGEGMPAHPGLFNVLGQQGYHTAFYNGTDTSFDNERAYMQLQQVQSLVDMKNFGEGYQRNPFSSWGYPDKELVSRVLADSDKLQQPFLLAVQTISMHTAYQFPGQDSYKQRFEQRMQQLQVPEAKRAGYRANADIYSTIVYTDDQLRRYFEEVSKAPWYANTIFVVTGDHRLPEIPMGEHVDRYHVPLIVFSPLLKQPKRIRAVSSQLDVTPSLMALLSNTYGLKRPAQVAWLGTGLDMADSFRNQHQLPLQQTKTSAPEYLADRWWLREGKLYELQDGMHLAEADDAGVRDWVNQRLQRYQQANATFMQQAALLPGGAAQTLVAYQAPAVTTPPTAGAAPSAHGVSMASAELSVGADGVQLLAVFGNGDAAPSRMFVPLAVMSSEDGRELQEVYGQALQLPPNGNQQVRLLLQQPAQCNGRCFVSVFPSDPDTGKAVGQGRYHLPVSPAPTGTGP